jgi:sortase A
LAGKSLLGEWAFAHWQGGRLETAIARANTGREGGGREGRPPGTAIARLDIPRLGLSRFVIDGVEKDELDVAVGRIPGSAPFGKTGTAALAGHRDRQFRDLRNIQLGDTLRIWTVGERYTYVVEKTCVVDPDAVDVLDAAGYPKLTLVTCYPFRYIGPAPRRFIVDARQVEPAG